MVRTIILKLNDPLFTEVELMKKEAGSPSWESFFMNCYNCYKAVTTDATDDHHPETEPDFGR